ncbi:MAG: transporter substrate-binding domain-containing protein [Spirochaetia bacterium]|nr:transporter substrate-binding domain-containing protein [Spirochaetia bacterium]
MKKFLTMFMVLLLACSFTCFGKTKVQITGIQDLDGKKIGVQSGTTGEAWVQKNVNKVKLSSFKAGIDAALDLKIGAIDCVVLDELPATSVVKKNADLQIIRDPFFAANKEEYAIAVKKGNQEILDIINATIKETKENGVYESLIEAFMPIDGKIVVPTYKAPEASETIKLGTSAAFPPFEYVDGKNYAGFDIAMGEYIATKAGKKLEVVNMSFDSLIPALQAGTIDFIAAGMSVTEERKKNVDFSVPYYASEQVIIIKK